VLDTADRALDDAVREARRGHPGSAANGSLASSTKYSGGGSAVAGLAEAAVTAATSTVRIAINR
jgi:hypothetical protein